MNLCFLKKKILKLRIKFFTNFENLLVDLIFFCSRIVYYKRLEGKSK